MRKDPLEKLKKLYDPKWTLLIRKSTYMDGLIAAKIAGGFIYVLVSRNPDVEDIEAQCLPLDPEDPRPLKLIILDVVRHGHELAYSKAKDMFPSEYAALENIMQGK